VRGGGGGRVIEGSGYVSSCRLKLGIVGFAKGKRLTAKSAKVRKGREGKLLNLHARDCAEDCNRSLTPETRPAEG
jgi:hypothetical protein